METELDNYRLGYEGMRHERDAYADLLRSLGYGVDFRGVYKDGKYLFEADNKAAVHARTIEKYHPRKD